MYKNIREREGKPLNYARCGIVFRFAREYVWCAHALFKQEIVSYTYRQSVETSVPITIWASVCIHMRRPEYMCKYVYVLLRVCNNAYIMYRYMYSLCT